MGTNFQFLKKINNSLFGIISEAEKLYRDEYFEQCMAQTRRFGEHVCKEIMNQNGQQTGTFDEMLATLKDKSHGYPQEKEFLEDLYFLKKNGNRSVHSGTVSKDAITALECLKCSFEVAINYAVYNQGASANILKLDYDIDLLVTNKKSSPSLQQKYEEAKRLNYTNKYVEKPNKQIKRKETKLPNSSLMQEKGIKISVFWKLIIFLTAVSLTISAILSICVVLKQYV